MSKELKLHYTFTRHNQLTTDSGKMVQINQKKNLILPYYGNLEIFI